MSEGHGQGQGQGQGGGAGEQRGGAKENKCSQQMGNISNMQIFHRLCIIQWV